MTTLPHEGSMLSGDARANESGRINSADSRPGRSEAISLARRYAKYCFPVETPTSYLRDMRSRVVITPVALQCSKQSTRLRGKKVAMFPGYV